MRSLTRRVPTAVRAAYRNLLDPGIKSPYSRYAYSQEGEDGLLARMLEGSPIGFYVDVGAHHPERFSNTRSLYACGWRGINVDASPGSMAEFRRLRPRDVNLELAVGTHRGRATLHVFDEPALNSLSTELTKQREETTRYSLITEVEVPVRPLSEILDEYLPRDTKIDLLTVDVEGRDLDVLMSNDWRRYRPRIVLMEVLDTALDALAEQPEIQFLSNYGYRPFAKLVNTVMLTVDGDWAWG